MQVLQRGNRHYPGLERYSLAWQKFVTISVGWKAQGTFRYFVFIFFEIAVIGLYKRCIDDG